MNPNVLVMLYWSVDVRSDFVLVAFEEFSYIFVLDMVLSSCSSYTLEIACSINGRLVLNLSCVPSVVSS